MDAYSEAEQATAFLTTLEQCLPLPFGATVLREAVTAERIDLSGARERESPLGPDPVRAHDVGWGFGDASGVCDRAQIVGRSEIVGNESHPSANLKDSAS